LRSQYFKKEIKVRLPVKKKFIIASRIIFKLSHPCWIYRLRNSKTEESNSTAYVLSVSDNGVGIPKGLDIEDLDSLGLQLVNSLVEQLNAELELERNNGTEFTIRFTVIEKNDQALAPADQQLIE